MTASRRKDLIALIALLLITQGVYLSTLAPTLTAEDSGELITAAITLGVPHSPGYPLWTLLGHLFSYLPSASPAWSINYMSSVFASLTVLYLFMLARLLKQTLPIAVFSALVFAFSRHFWSQAVITEVYTLHLFLLTQTLFFLVKWRRHQQRAALYIAAFSFGLGLANHYMLTLLAAPALFFYLISPFLRTPFRKWPWQTFMFGLGFSVVPLLFYAYLPWAASFQPIINWGDPSNWERFWDVVTRVEYREIDFGQKGNLGDKAKFLGHFLEMLLLQFTPYLCIPLLLLGLSQKTDRWAEQGLFVGIIVLNGPVLIGILQFRFEVENQARVEEYYLQAWLGIALLMGMGIQRMVSTRSKTAITVVACGSLILPFLAHYHDNNQSDNYLTYDYNKTILDSLEKDGIYFPSGDVDIFASLYLQVIEDQRPDVFIPYFLGGIMSKGLQQMIVALGHESEFVTIAQIQKLFLTKTSRPIYVASASDFQFPKEYPLTLWGWVYRVLRPSQPLQKSTLPTLSAETALRQIKQPAALDEVTRQILAKVYLMEGENAMASGNQELALHHYKISASYASNNPKFLTALGVVCLQRGCRSEGEQFLRQAIAISEHFRPARYHLAQYYFVQGNLGAALTLYEELEILEPNNALLKTVILQLREKCQQQPNICMGSSSQ